MASDKTSKTSSDRSTSNENEKTETQKPKVPRVIKADDMKIYINEVMTLAGQGKFDGNVISCADIAEYFKVSMSAAKDIVFESFNNGLTGFKVDWSPGDKGTLEAPFVNENGVIMIGKKHIDSINKGMSDGEKKIEKKDKFEVAWVSGTIVLRPAGTKD